MALVSQADVEAKLGRALTGEEQTAFTLTNAALQAYIEAQIGSSLETANASTRYYDGGLQNLPIDPCTDITALKRVDEDENTVDTYDTSDYTTEPVNKTLKTWLRHRYSTFSRGFNNIAVTAKFSIGGDTDMQNMVKALMVDMLVNEVTSGIGEKKKESIEGYSVEYVTAETKQSLAVMFNLFQRVI